MKQLLTGCKASEIATNEPEPLNERPSPDALRSPSCAIIPNSNETGPASGVLKPEIGISSVVPTPIAP